MKFGKMLKTWAEEEMPQHTDLFLRFKELKKQLKLIKPPESGAISVDEHNEITVELPSDREDPTASASRDGDAQLPAIRVPSAEETQFLRTLEEDLNRFNEFFIDKEEDFIIQMGLLEDKVENEKDPQALRRIRKSFMDVHGSMILLINWSMLNFTAVLKILKKHDKCSSTVLRKPLLSSLLTQPFNSTERISELIRTAEKRCKDLLENDGVDCMEGDEDMHEEQAEMSRQTKAALGLWEQMSKTASTPSTVMPVFASEGSKTCKDTEPATDQAVLPSPKRLRKDTVPATT